MRECSHIDLRQTNLTAVQIVAAIGVIFSHSYRIGVGGKEPLSEFAFGKCTCGTVAVAVFLFMSGFLVCRSYSDLGCSAWNIVSVCKELYNFVVKRLLRILPTVAFAILVCAFFLGPCVSRLSVREYFEHPQTWRYLQGAGLHVFRSALPGVFEQNAFKSSVNGCLWVIPWQMWCYWMVAAFGAVGLHARRRVILIVCSLVWAIYYGRFVLLKGVPWPGGISLMQGSRLIAFFLTGWCASLYFDKIQLDGRLTLGLACSLPIWIWTPASDIALGLVGAYVLLYLIFKHPVSMLQRLPPISFGIFVLGFPVQQTLAYLWGGQMPHTLNFILSLLIVIPLAMIEYWTVERPIGLLRKKLLVATGRNSVEHSPDGRSGKGVS